MLFIEASMALGAVLRVGTFLGFGAAAAADLYRLHSRNRATDPSNLVFPRDLVNNDEGHVFFISFSFQKYVKRSITNSPFLKAEGTIALPLPNNLRDNTTVNYSTENLGPAVGAGLEAASSLIGRGSSVDALDALNAGINTASGIFAGGVSNLDANKTNALKALTGTAINNFQTVLFDSPQFKSHLFSWKLFPRDEEESKILRTIVKTFNRKMLPGVASSGAFFSFPDIVNVELFPTYKWLYKFKPCVIDNLSVNYASGSTPAFFKGTYAPAAVTVSLQLREIEYWTENDVDAEIGQSASDVQTNLNRQAASTSQTLF